MKSKLINILLKYKDDWITGLGTLWMAFIGVWLLMLSKILLGIPVLLLIMIIGIQAFNIFSYEVSRRIIVAILAIICLISLLLGGKVLWGLN